MIDAVLSYHMNGATCGVAKWNAALAARLNVPMYQLTSDGANAASFPLVSVKHGECPLYSIKRRWPRFNLFLHDWVGGPRVERWYYQTEPDTVYAANAVIARAAMAYGIPAVVAFCPSTIAGTAHRGRFNVLTFGMAHKLVLPHFARLKAQLDAEQPDYTVSLSTAVHEGSPWDTALTDSVTAMRAIFGDKLRVLGYLGDDALAKELQDCDAVAAYFTPALRANNTSAWAALDAGKPLYTNTDEFSPPLDATAHSWDKLLEIIRA